MSAGAPTLFLQTGSHPCAAVEVAARMKGLDYRRVNLLPLTQVLVGPLLWGGPTVPGMRLDGRRITGSREIMRRLDELAPEPPLLPAAGDPRRARILEIERWGDEVFQGVARRAVDAGFLRDPACMESFAGDEKLLLPRAVLRPALPATARLMALRNHARDEAVRADLAALPVQLDRVDGWIAEGLLGGEAPNAADLQVGSTLQLLMTLEDLRPLIEGRPCAALLRYFPPAPGHIPAGTLPAGWLP